MALSSMDSTIPDQASFHTWRGRVIGNVIEAQAQRQGIAENETQPGTIVHTTTFPASREKAGRAGCVKGGETTHGVVAQRQGVAENDRQLKTISRTLPAFHHDKKKRSKAWVYQGGMSHRTVGHIDASPARAKKAYQMVV
jgi:hypothetical protein